MKLAAVLFDFDGVIVDTEPIYDRLTRELLAELGAQPPPELFDRLRGLRAADEWLLVANELSLDITIAELKSRAEERRRTALLTGDPVPEIRGARRLIRDLVAQDLPIAVVSSSPTDRVRRMLERLQLDGDVRAVVGGDATRRGKPHPDGYLTAARSLGVPAARCVVVEDSHRGVEAGVRAGAACIQVTSGDPHPGAMLAVPDLTAVSVDELSGIVSLRG